MTFELWSALSSPLQFHFMDHTNNLLYKLLIPFKGQTHDVMQTQVEEDYTVHVINIRGEQNASKVVKNPSGVEVKCVGLFGVQFNSILNVVNEINVISTLLKQDLTKRTGEEIVPVEEQSLISAKYSVSRSKTTILE